MILLTFLVGAILLIKKYGNNLPKSGRINPISGGFPSIGDPKQMEESMKMISNLMKGFGKK